MTLLFADIVNFTKYSSSETPNNVVNMLRELFTEFDKECQKLEVYKVYTIGDCYVVMGFVNALLRNPIREAKNVIQMGLSMIEIIRKVRTKVDFQELDMRIGVHTVDFSSLNKYHEVLGGRYRGDRRKGYRSIRHLWERRSDSK